MKTQRRRPSESQLKFTFDASVNTTTATFTVNKDEISWAKFWQFKKSKLGAEMKPNRVVRGLSFEC